jgi:DNA-binding SARP family transcriptional activator
MQRRGTAISLSPLEQLLLAYLLLHRDTPQSRQQVAFLFWPDSTDAQSRGQLRKLYYRMRRHLPDANLYLQAKTQTVQWRPDGPFTLDVAEFDRALDEAERALDEAAREDRPPPRSQVCQALERGVDL